MLLLCAAVVVVSCTYAYVIVMRSAEHAGQQSAAVQCHHLSVRTRINSRSTYDSKPVISRTAQEALSVPTPLVWYSYECGWSLADSEDGRA